MHSQLADFMAYLKIERQVSPHTLEAYQRDLNQFFKFAPDPLALKKASILSQYSLYLTQQGYKPSTHARKLSALKSFSSFLYKEGILSSRTHSAVIKPKVPSRLPEILNEAQVGSLLNQPHDASGLYLRDSAILECLYGCGLRVSECTSLKRTHLKLNSDLIQVRGKGRKDRLVPIGEVALDQLTRYLDLLRPQLARAWSKEFVFLTKNGTPFTRQGLYSLVKKYARLAGLNSEVSPHTLRHSYATHLLSGNAQLIEVQRLLGHADIRSTQIYTKVSVDRLKAVHKQAHPRSGE